MKDDSRSTTTLRVVRQEIRHITDQINREKSPDRVRALGDVLEQLNARYERLEKELIEES